MALAQHFTHIFTIFLFRNHTSINDAVGCFEKRITIGTKSMSRLPEAFFCDAHKMNLPHFLKPEA